MALAPCVAAGNARLGPTEPKAPRKTSRTTALEAARSENLALRSLLGAGWPRQAQDTATGASVPESKTASLLSEKLRLRTEIEALRPLVTNSHEGATASPRETKNDRSLPEL